MIGDFTARSALVRVPGLYDLERCLGCGIGISVDGTLPQWTALRGYAPLVGQCTTQLSLTEPIAVPVPTADQLARRTPPTQFRLFADFMLAVRLDPPQHDDSTAVIW